METAAIHTPTNPVRFVTAASLFDGHDASINIMRRILQSQGVEVIHLGHNRSVDDVARAIVFMDSLPLDTNVPSLTIMATLMPFIGRG